VAVKIGLVILLVLLGMGRALSWAGFEVRSNPHPFRGVPVLEPDRAHSKPRYHLDRSYGRIPLHFEANQGRTDPAVRFLCRGKGYALFLTPTETVLSLNKGDPREAPTLSGLEGPAISEPPGKRAVLRMRFAGASEAPSLTGEDELPGKVSHWHPCRRSDLFLGLGSRGTRDVK